MTVCRIFGYLDPVGGPARLEAAAAMLEHGGPDGSGWRHGQGWGLGAARLAITDPVGGAQPYRHGAITTVFNGEIYNHRELRAGLEAQGYRFDDDCDGSILPALYEVHGHGFAALLEGMYAIGVVDHRSGRPHLTLAVDGAGIKPLYLRRRGRSIAFASELPALLAMNDQRPELRLLGFDAYLTERAPFGPHTMFDGIDVLAPGEALVCNGIDLPTLTKAAASQPEDCIREPQELAAIIAKQITTMTPQDVPAATVCSGGLDSSLVTAMLAKEHDGLEAFHLAYKGEWPFDERHYAEAVCTRAGIRLHTVELDPADVPLLLEDAVAALGQPNADPTTVAALHLFRTISAHGYKVAFTGDGADEIFAGYDRVRAATYAETDWQEGYIDALAAVPRWLRWSLYSEEYRTFLRQNGTERQRLLDHLHETPCDRIEAASQLEIGQRLPHYHLRKLDHLSMASAVEVRVPYCQPAVMAAAAGIPPTERLDREQGKLLLTRAAADYLPTAVLRRRKQPFTLPLTAMLDSDVGLMPFLREVVTDPSLNSHGLLDARALRRTADRHEEQPSDATAMALWSIAVFNLWYGRYFT